jgi:hypothetical protein
VRILVENRPKVLTVPIEAVVKQDGRSYVVKLASASGGKQQKNRTEVQTGARNDRELELVSGVEEGEKLLIDPASASANEAKL